MRNKQNKQKKKNTQSYHIPPTYKLENHIEAKTPNQKDFIRSIVENDITVCHGTAGTGKTMVSIGIACQYLCEGKVDNILYCRSIVSAGDSIGYLPGSLSEKTGIYMDSGLEYFNYFFSQNHVRQHINDKVIKLYPVELLRGHTYHNSFMILDEAANADPKQIKLFMSRMGQNSKMVIIGDTRQCDISNNGLNFLVKHFQDINGLGFVQFTPADILRHGLLGEVLKRFENHGV